VSKGSVHSGCTNAYEEHAQTVPGIGIALDSDDQVIRYSYLPFVEPIPKSRLDSGFEADDLYAFNNIRFYRFWLFQISKESFVRTVGEQIIRWP
jgi:hypothetical protein